MDYIYMHKVTAYQAESHPHNQLDIPKEMVENFFDNKVPTAKGNFTINLAHESVADRGLFQTLEIQTATNFRFSTDLNAMMDRYNESLEADDILVFTRFKKSYVVRNVKKANPEYSVLLKMFYSSRGHVCVNAYINDVVVPNTSKSLSYRPYVTAIKTKPFMLLAGISGTGKSRIVRELARACWPIDSEQHKQHKPENYEIIQVKPNWYDSTELIGYLSRITGESEFIEGPFLRFIAKAWENEKTPYFLCLDEMNLARVEQYFAEYLSVIESRKYDPTAQKIITDPILQARDEQWYFDLTARLTQDENLRSSFNTNGITIPQNLIVVGTVNMDESACSFSRKVLDRAMTIEMNDVDLSAGLSKEETNDFFIEPKNFMPEVVEGCDVYESNEDVCQTVIQYLQKVNSILEGTPFKIAYRTRNEFLIYVIHNLPYKLDDDNNAISDEKVIARALDEITNMKILSRIEGDDTKVPEKLLIELKQTILSQLQVIDSTYIESESISIKKVDEMIKRLSSGFTSFWS